MGSRVDRDLVIPEWTEEDFASAIRSDRRERIIAGRIEPGDVAAVRRFVRLSQEQFAEALGIGLDTLSDWEQERVKPEGPGLALLRIAARSPWALRSNLATVTESPCEQCGAEGAGEHDLMRERRTETSRVGYSSEEAMMVHIECLERGTTAPWERVNGERLAPVYATRAWVSHRVVFCELDNGSVFGLPALMHDDLAALTDEELDRVRLWKHEYGDVLQWQWGENGERFSISVWDFVEGAPRAVRAWSEGRTVLFEVKDGRVFGFPADDFEQLRSSSDEALSQVQVRAQGYVLRWDDPVDEDISVPGIVARNRSNS